MHTNLEAEHGSARRPRSEGAPIRRDVVVVGGGQAGLAIGYVLARDGREFTILEAANEPPAAWRERWYALQEAAAARPAEPAV